MKTRMMVAMMVAVIAMAGLAVVPAQAGSIGVNLGGGVVASGEWAGAPGYAQQNWNNASGAEGWFGAAHPAPVDDSGAVLPGVTVSWYGDNTWTGWYPSGGTQGDKDLFYYGLIDNAGGNNPSALVVGGIPYDNYDVLVYMMSNHEDRGVEVTMSGEPTYCGQPTNTGFNGTWIQATSTTPAGPTLGASHAIFAGQTGSVATIMYTRRTAGVWQDEGWVAGIQIAEPPTPTVLIPHVGDHVDVPDWRTTTVAKPLDADGDNVYGTDGWIRPYGPHGHDPYVSNPSYLSVQYLGMQNIDDRPTEGYVDDAVLSGPAPIADVEAGRVEKPGTVNDMIQIDVTADASFRLGVMSDFIVLYAGAGPEAAPTGIRVRQTIGGAGDSNWIRVPAKNGVADFMFFDIIDAKAGDQFIVYVASSTNPWGWSQISHASFDTTQAPIPEPAGLGLIGLALLAVRRKRS